MSNEWTIVEHKKRKPAKKPHLSNIRTSTTRDLDHVIFRNSKKSRTTRKKNNTTLVAKYNAGKNKQSATINAAAIERKMNKDKYHLPKISDKLRKDIQKGRQQKNWSQKELANACNIPISVIKLYEQGKGMPNHKYISVMSRALGVPLSNK